MTKMDWRKTKKFSGSIEKYEPGKIFENGHRVLNRPIDLMDKRARKEERDWERNPTVKPDDGRTLVITESHINQLRTPAGGFNSATMRLFGLWPLKNGWQQQLIGRRISLSLWEKANKAKKVPRKSRRIKKQRTARSEALTEEQQRLEAIRDQLQLN